MTLWSEQEEEPEEERPQVLRVCEGCGKVLEITQWVYPHEGKMLCLACFMQEWD